MGSYLYEQVSKIFRINTPSGSGFPAVIVANEVKYRCKPDWYLWNDGVPISPYEEAEARQYRRMRGCASRRKVNELVALFVPAVGDEQGEGHLLLYRWADISRASIFFCDDATFGRELICAGRACRDGRGRWILGKFEGAALPAGTVEQLDLNREK